MNMPLLDSVRADVQSFLENNKKLMFNERDLQMHLALYLLNTQKYTNVHMEYYVPYKELEGPQCVWKSDLRLDIVIEKDGKFCPIELKYKTKKEKFKISRFNQNLKSSVNILKDHSARDIGRYHFWKDVRRIELVKEFFSNVIGGLAVFVTNDSSYKASPGENTNDIKFSMSGDGVHGKYKFWTQIGSYCEQKYPKFEVDKEYAIIWGEYKIAIDNHDVDFHYCIVSI